MKPRKVPAQLFIEGNNGSNKSVAVRLEFKENADGWHGSVQTLEPVLTESATHRVNLGDYRFGTIRLHEVARNGKTARFTGEGIPQRVTKAARA